MDAVIENEIKDHIYLDLPAFFQTFPDSVDGLLILWMPFLRVACRVWHL